VIDKELVRLFVELVLRPVPIAALTVRCEIVREGRTGYSPGEDHLPGPTTLWMKTVPGMPACSPFRSSPRQRLAGSATQFFDVTSGKSGGIVVMDSVQVGDGTLSAETRGSGEALLLVHGAMIADSYGLMLDQGDLTGSFQVITFHRRGFGGSTAAVADHTIADEAADALAVLDHYGIDSAHVVGHSYGGAVALRLAIDAPDRVVHWACSSRLS
jgi:pimeloyl-ACP methyl ester carboxylesterase